MLIELLELAHIGGGGVLGGGEAHLLAADVLLQLRNTGLGLRLRVLQQLGLLGLRLGHQLVGHLLGGKQGLAHGLLGGAVLLHLVHQYLHLGLEGGVFLIERGVVRRQYVQKFIHHRHVIAAEGRLGKGVLGNFLWCQHNVIPPICSCLPHPMLRIGREPPLWHLPGNVDSPGIRVLAVPKRLKRRTPGGTTRTFSCPEEQFRNTARCSPVRQSDRLKYPRCRA